MSSRTVLASLSGRTGAITPASARVLRLNGTSVTDPRGPSVNRLPAPMIRSGRSTARRLVEVDQGHGHASDSLAAADRSHALVGGRLDAGRRPGRRGEDPLHLVAVRAQPRPLADHRCIDVENPAAELAD